MDLLNVVGKKSPMLRNPKFPLAAPAGASLFKEAPWCREHPALLLSTDWIPKSPASVPSKFPITLRCTPLKPVSIFIRFGVLNDYLVSAGLRWRLAHIQCQFGWSCLEPPTCWSTDCPRAEFCAFAPLNSTYVFSDNGIGLPVSAISAVVTIREESA